MKPIRLKVFSWGLKLGGLTEQGLGEYLGRGKTRYQLARRFVDESVMHGVWHFFQSMASFHAALDQLTL